MIDIKKMTLEEKVGQLFMLGVKDEAHMTTLIDEYHVGGIIYFTRNVENAYDAYHLSKLIKEKSNVPAFISIDQEGGIVTRIKNGLTPVSGQMAIAATKNPEHAKDVATILSIEMSQLGINMNLAPVVDVNNNPKNPVINVRSFGDNPRDVSTFSLKALEAYQSEKMIAVAKHFPGHGDTDLDSHTSLPIVSHDINRLRDIELKPYEVLIDKGLDAIMVSHVLFSNISSENMPATLSKDIIDGLLRKDLKFDGLVMTDCMEMHAISKNFGIEESVIMSLKAGVDMLLFSHTLSTQISSIKAVVQAVKDDKLDEKIIDNAVRRIFKYKLKYDIDDTLMSWDIAKTNIKTKEHVELSKRISLKSITQIGDDIQFDSDRLYVFPKTKVTEEVMKSKENFLYDSLDALTVERIILASKSYKQVIFASRDLIDLDMQNRLISSMNTVVVLLGSPYDFSKLNCMRCLCTYELTHLAIESLFTIIEGHTINGHLPVNL